MTTLPVHGLTVFPFPTDTFVELYLILPGMKSCISLVTNLLHPESIHHSKSSQLSMYDFCESLGLMLWFWVKHWYAKFLDMVALEAIYDVMSGGRRIHGKYHQHAEEGDGDHGGLAVAEEKVVKTSRHALEEKAQGHDEHREHGQGCW